MFGQQGPGKKKDGLPPKAHYSIWYFLMAILLFTYVQRYFSSSNVETIPYSQFKQKVTEGSVSKLTVDPESISGTLKGKDNSRVEDWRAGLG
ncbi:MAG: ATP-dependent metallopeptidase FtsH/Yme1/Tma family protein [Syntrophorhabdales bacterium]